MNTDFAWPNGLTIVFVLSYYYDSVILVIHTHKSTLALILKFSSPKMLSFRKKSFYIFEWEMNTDFASPNGLAIPIFLLSYYYKSVILVIHTHKSTLAFIKHFSCPKMLSFRQKWFCRYEWEMNTYLAWPNGLAIPIFWWVTTTRV